MKKLFFTICFTFSFLLFGSAGAEISSITNMPKRSQPRPLTLGDILPDNMPDPNNEEEVRAFFKKRFEEAAQTVMDDKTDWNNASSVDVAYPPEYYQAQEEAQKTLFQKMYDQAVAAVTQSENDPAQGEFADRQVAQSATRFSLLPTILQKHRLPVRKFRLLLFRCQAVVKFWRRHVSIFLIF